jgi:hypothetical protein
MSQNNQNRCSTIFFPRGNAILHMHEPGVVAYSKNDLKPVDAGKA